MTDLIIAHNLKTDGPKPRRGGTLLDDATCAAPPGLGKIIGGRGCYKDVAPLELGLPRRVWVRRVQHRRQANR